MTLIAGIDEAGFGPVLGPLVVTATAFTVGAQLADESMWSLLAPDVVRRPGKRRPGLAIADSKKLYARKSKAGLRHLERGVLAMLAARGHTPAGLDELVALLAPAAKREAGEYPWYAALDLPLPLRASATDVALTGNAVAAKMAARGMDIVAVRSEILFAGRFNRIVQATRNKATALLDVTFRLLMWLWRREEKDLRIHVDRQGGRIHYLRALRRVFPDCQTRVLEEDAARSSYRLTCGEKCAVICFHVAGERAHLPVALASMTSKYFRELFMTMLNRFWAGHVPDLAPTAGYYVDGRRFFAQIETAAAELNLDRSLLYRTR